ncbi:MAG: MBL fold metallo-hydrolase [Acidimicrobiia bacterium]|nr:MBL fold metallo-hydrolase [Acidimicrobiia bacterium]
MAYERGLHEVGDSTWAYLQPDGGWGWSNAGLVADGDASLLVDTLFDLRLTAEMLESMRRATAAAEVVDTVVNTHANGDHCYGNQLVAGAEIVASAAGAREMEEVPASMLAGLVAGAPGLGPVGAFITRIFGSFSFEGIELVAPTRTFDGEVTLRVGDREVRLLELGPAHTAGDVAVHVPDAGVVFTGDLVFNGGHPIVWAGPVANWISACDRLLALDADHVVPGHGPLGDKACIEAERGYLQWLLDEGSPRLQGGLSPLDAARDLAGGPYAGWGEGERLVVNLTAVARDLGLSPADDVLTLFGGMAELAASSRTSEVETQPT